MNKLIQETVQQIRRVLEKLESEQRSTIQQIADLLCDALESGHKILLCGNGGSAADSQHVAAELVVRFQKERRGLPAIALTTDTSILTAAGNDYDFPFIFSRQVEALGQSGDVLVGFSTSGDSPNVNEAMKTAKTVGMACIAFTGNRQGPILKYADAAIEVPSAVTARIQEAHIVTGHILCDMIEKRLFPDA